MNVIPWMLNCIYFIFLLLVSPILFYRVIFLKKYREGFREKLWGLVPELPPIDSVVIDSSHVGEGESSPKYRKRIWFHAVSVGEMNLLKPILKQIEVQHPDWECVISSTSKTGRELGGKIFPNHIVFYCPLDFSGATNRAMMRIKPDILVLVELELWPNLILSAKKRNIKVAIINGRISDRSYRHYRWIKHITRWLFRKIDLIAVQDETADHYFRSLGALNTEKTGSIKFDGVQMDRNNMKTRELSHLAGLQSSSIVFLAGSTQEPEEEYALNVYRQLHPRFSDLRLIVVPRHSERFDVVAHLLEKSGLPWVRRSMLTTDNPPDSNPIILVDTIGELGAWWGTATLAFVGGSMGSRGGQNMLEPAGYGAVVSFGPNTRNFKDIASKMIRCNAAVVVANENELLLFIEKGVSDIAWRNEMGKNAKSLVLDNLGATSRTIELISLLLKMV